ncbi:hypothetical protein SAMN06309944_0736 [Micrococcales bacterium KH10]|nr:hypothetical protein SAMN06309944_0736 [Micrococcales bacterium KH10]
MGMTSNQVKCVRCGEPVGRPRAVYCTVRCRETARKARARGRGRAGLTTDRAAVARDLARAAQLVDGQHIAAKKGALIAELERARQLAGDLSAQVRDLTDELDQVSAERDRSRADLDAVTEDAQWFAVLIAGQYKRAKWKGYTGQVRDRCERYVVTGQ